MKNKKWIFDQFGFEHLKLQEDDVREPKDH